MLVSESFRTRQAPTQKTTNDDVLPALAPLALRPAAAIVDLQLFVSRRSAGLLIAILLLLSAAIAGLEFLPADVALNARARRLALCKGAVTLPAPRNDPVCKAFKEELTEEIKRADGTGAPVGATEQLCDLHERNNGEV